MNNQKSSGRVSAFSLPNGTGQLINEQGDVLSFTHKDWLGCRSPSAGMQVRYITTEHSQARQIEHIPMMGKVIAIDGEQLTIQHEQSEAPICGQLIRWRNTPEPKLGDQLLFDLDMTTGTAINIEFAFSKDRVIKPSPAPADIPPTLHEDKPRRLWLIPLAVICSAFAIFLPQLSLIAIGVFVVVFLGVKEYLEEAELKRQLTCHEAAAYELGKRKGYRKGRAESLFDN